jgi:hypothetical protein
MCIIIYYTYALYYSIIVYVFYLLVLCVPSGLKSKISYTPEDGHVGRNM